jgi:helicase SWR1
MRDVHIYRFVSEHTVEEAMLRKANQKRTLDDLVIQKGRFDWSSLFGSGDEGTAAPLQATLDEGALAQALGQFEDREDQEAAQQAAAEEGNMAKDDAADFQFEDGGVGPDPEVVHDITLREEEQDAEPYIWGQGGYIVQYMLDYVERESEEDFFAGWRI